MCHYGVPTFKVLRELPLTLINGGANRHTQNDSQRTMRTSETGRGGEAQLKSHCQSPRPTPAAGTVSPQAC